MRREAEAKQVHEGQEMIGGSGRVSVVPLDLTGSIKICVRTLHE